MSWPFRGPYQLDPFDHIVAIHFPKRAITKLDFVNNRYMVKGKTQTLPEVIGMSHGFFGLTPEQQVALRTSEGLDLRPKVGGEVDWLGDPVRAYLRNKTNAPDADNPGALNEWLRLDYTYIFECDWFDLQPYFDDPAVGGASSDIWDFLWNVGPQFQTFAINSTVEEFELTPYTPEFNSGDPIPYVLVESYWDTGYAEESDLIADAVAYQEIIRPTGPRYPVSPRLQYPLGGGSWYVPAEVFGWFPNLTQGSFVGAWQPVTYLGTGTGTVYSPTQPDPLIATTHIDETLATYGFRNHPSLFLGDDLVGDVWGEGRYIGGTPAPGGFIPVSNNAIPAAFGRMRVALTVTGSKYEISVNGGAPIVHEAAADFPMPRPYPTGYDYYKIEPRTVGSAFMNYVTWMSFFGIMRCMWLSRKKFSGADLQAMSEINPLPLANSPYWTRLPGQDQPT